ncbi:7572_t:CDS:2 [Scutellospora calospora]|uniref:7572_t:CDS:1 n=1 Tax=Scutellospora calospora TaxID=85575 RepID=A0ACA9N0W5_9GLOM|nr:7572_t:CDS:2 [Scutellospora calospora]
MKPTSHVWCSLPGRPMKCDACHGLDIATELEQDVSEVLLPNPTQQLVRGPSEDRLRKDDQDDFSLESITLRSPVRKEQPAIRKSKRH